MPTAATPAWERLGAQLVRRRIELDSRYSNRQLFAAERHIGYRTISDIERHRRDNYDESTLAAVEVAYALTTGSIAAVLGGGNLEALPSTHTPTRPPPPSPRDDEPKGDAAWDLFPDDPVKRHLWRTPHASEKDRAAMIRWVDEQRTTGDAEAGQRDAAG